MRRVERYSILLHVIGWLLFFSVPFLAMPENRVLEKPQFMLFIIPMMLNNVFLMLFFYINLYYLVPNLLFKRHAGLYIFWLFVGFAGMVVLNMGISTIIIKPSMSVAASYPEMPPPPMPHDMPMPGTSAFPELIIPLVSYTLVGLMGTLLAFIRERIRNKEEKQQIEIEKTAAELAMLKLQISPHFLFNTLNNIRWLARQKSDKTEDAVVKLSTLLRYILYHTNEAKVLLIQEIKHLEDYIELQKMRLTERTSVHFRCDGEIHNFRIEPLIYIPFVENAFKYGVHNSRNSEINISIKVIDKHLTFVVENTVFESNIPSNEDSGIGIQNVQRRLEMFYPALHDLKIEQQEGKFLVNLKIELGEKNV